MVISEFDQAREMPLVRHPHLEKNPWRVAENPGRICQAIWGTKKVGAALFFLTGK